MAPLARTSRATCRPPSTVGLLDSSRTASSRDHSQAACTPSQRRADIQDCGGPATKATFLCPLAARLRTASLMPLFTSGTTHGTPSTSRLMTTTGLSRAMVADVVVVHARAGKDEAVHGGHHPAGGGQLGGCRFGGLGQHQGVVPQRGGGLGPADDVEEGGVGDVRDDQAEGVGAAGGQRAGERVDLVVQLGGGVLDEFLRLGADPAGLAERPGDRGRIDAGNLGDVVDGGFGLCRPGRASWPEPLVAATSGVLGSVTAPS